MKKIISAIFATFILSAVSSTALFAQKFDMRVGGSFIFEKALGDINDFADFSMGGEVVLQTGLPILENLDLGVSLRASFNKCLMKDTEVEALTDMRFSLGAYTILPFADGKFNIVPEIGYGVVMNYPKVTGSLVGNVKDKYIDQMVQAAIGLRFASPNLLDGRLEFELAPTYTMCFEKGAFVQYAGGRVGVLFKFLDK